MALDYDYLDKAFEEAAKTYGIDPDILRGIGYAESQFNPAAVNPKSGAAGMMQFMPGTAKQFGINPNDPVEAIFGAAAHLKRDLDRFGGDYNKAIASYNWGPNRDVYNQPEWHKALPDETFKYVNRVLNYATGQDEGIARMPIKPKLRPMEPAQQVEGEPVAPQPQAAPAQPKPAQPEAEPERTLSGTAGDVGAALLKGAIGVPQMAVGLADLVSGGAAGKKLEELGFRPEEAKKIIDEMMSSDAQKAARARVQKSEGFVDRAKALGTNPSVLAETVVESVFPMLAGGVIGRGVKAATGMGALKAGAVGEGAATAGGMAAKMREESPDKELSAKQALSAVGAGVGTGVLGVAGGKLAEKLKLADIDTMIVGGADDAARAAAATAKRGFTARVVGSGLSESAFEELPQSSQEQMWENFANDRPLMQGVPEAAATGLMAGAVMGGVAGGLARPRAETATPETEEAPTRPAPAAPTPEQLYDAQYFPIDAEGRRVVEEAEAAPEVPEPVVRGREPVAEAVPAVPEVEAVPAVPEAEAVPAVPEPTVRAPAEPPLVAEQDVDRTLPADQITLTMPDIRRLAQQAGYGPKALSGPTGKWWEDNVAGKTLAEAQELIKRQPSLLKGNGSRAALLSQLAIPDVVRPAVETNEEIAAKIAARDAQPAPEATNVPTTAVPTQESEARVRSATVGSGAGAGPAVPVETGTRVEPAAGAEPSAEVRVDRPAQLPARTDAGTTEQPPAVTPQAEPATPDTLTKPDGAPLTVGDMRSEIEEYRRLESKLPEAAIDTDLRDAREDWQASIATRLDEAKTRWEADAALQREENPKARVQDWESLPIERKYEAAKVVDWDALPDERKVEWVQAAIDRYSQPQAEKFYRKRFNQISNDVMREPPKPPPPAKTREENLTYPSLAKAQEVSTQLETRLEAIRQERKALATTNEKGETVPPADGTEEGLKYDKLTSQITQLENRKSLADRDIDIYALRLQQEVGESPKPLPPAEDVFGEEVPGPKNAEIIARNNVNRAYDRGDIDAPAAGKLYSMIEAGKAKQATAMLNRLRALTAEPGTTGALSDLRQNKTVGPRAVDFVRDLFSEYGEGAPIPKASYDAVEAGNASEALNVLAQQGTNEVVRETAARIAPLLANTRAELVENLQTPDGKAAAGAAAVDGSYIRLDRNRGMDEETLVHEGVHAAAERVISAPETELTEPQRSGKRELNAVWAAARNDTSIPLTEIARADVSEFASEAMSKKAVQDALRSKTLPESGNLWARFKRAVMRMVGLHQPKNMRDAVVDAMDKVFTAVPERAAPSKAVEARSVDETSTPAFKKWFGGSKVVDENGDPVVLYHGSPAEKINAFDPARRGASGLQMLGTGFYAGEEDYASEYYGPETKSITPLYAKIENPLYFEDGGDVTYSTPEIDAANIAAYEKVRSVDPQLAADVFRIDEGKVYRVEIYEAKNESGGRREPGQKTFYDRTKFERALDIAGVDGVIDWSPAGRKGGKPYIHQVMVRSNTQFKAVDENVGTFDPENPDIRYSLSPEVKRAVEAMPKKTRPIATGFIKATSPSISDVGITDYLLGAVDKYVRTNVMDKMATLELYVGRAEGYAVRNAAGEVKPLLQMRQAYDTDKLTQDLFIDGAIRFDPATRQFSTVDVKDTAQWADDGLPRYAPDDLPTAVAAWAKKNRMSFDEAWGKYLPKVFEAVRLHNIAKEAEAAGVKSKVQPHLSKDFIEKAVADYEADADLKEITAIMDAPRVRMIEAGVQTGRWTREEADRLSQVIGYVPFDRLAEAGELGSPDKRTKAGVASFGKIPELVGTTQFEVKNVFENYFNTLSFLMAEAVKNGASISTLRYMEKLGLAKHIGANPAAVQHKGRTVAAHIDGVLNFFEVPDRQTVVAFKYDTVPADGVRKLLGATSKFFRASITLFPTFSAKQVVDDVQRAAMTAGARNVAAVTASALEGYASLTKSQVTGERNPLVQKFGRKGLTAEIDWERQNPASSYLKDRGFQARGMKIAGVQVPFTSTLAELAHRLDGIAHASDLAVRNAVYEQVKKETGDEARAIAAARELINFRRQGASSVLTNYLIPSLPFFNAKLQGIDIMYRALTGRGAASGMSKNDALKSIATRGALALTVGTIYALAKAGDDEYENLSLEKRDRVWVLGGGVALPVPMEHAVLFKMIPERALEYFRRKGKPEEQAASEAFITWFNTAFMTYAGSPLTVPQAWKPLFENFVNYSFFTNRPLVGKHLEGVDRSEQAVASTSEFAKGLAAWTRDNIPGQPQISPIHVDNFVSGYFGSVGAAFNMVVDMFANPDKLDRPIHRVVGLGAFTYDPESSTRRKDEFYKLREDAAKAHTTLLKIGTEGDSEKYRKYEAKLAPVLEAYAMTNKTLEVLTNIRQEMNALQGNKEVIESYRKAAEEEVGPAKARSLAKDRREAEVLRLRAAEREMTGWVRSSVAEINKEKRRLKSEGINLDATP